MKPNKICGPKIAECKLFSDKFAKASGKTMLIQVDRRRPEVKVTKYGRADCDFFKIQKGGKPARNDRMAIKVE